MATCLPCIHAFLPPPIIGGRATPEPRPSPHFAGPILVPTPSAWACWPGTQKWVCTLEINLTLAVLGRLLWALEKRKLEETWDQYCFHSFPPPYPGLPRGM